MPAHHFDSGRDAVDVKPANTPYRLFGVKDDGDVYFYWSERPGEFAGYFGPNSDAVWGTLTHKNHMDPTNRVFIADIEMVRKLERFDMMRPCGICQREEYKVWKRLNKRELSGSDNPTADETNPTLGERADYSKFTWEEGSLSNIYIPGEDD